MSVDLRKVKKLIELVEESGISELEVSDGDETIRIARVMSAPREPASPAPATATAVSSAARQGPSAAGEFHTRAAMAGTFYRAPSPEAEPFVSVGESVQAGDVLCIIESMKMMNEIHAERSGLCVAIDVENGEAIGSGQILFRFE